MIIVACVDEHNGMLFNQRRQSQDRVLRERIIEDSADTKLWMNAYSYQQFSNMGIGNIVVDENFISKAGAGEYCFMENINAAAGEARAEKIILYHWNRTYPADMRFDIPLAAHGWKNNHREEFVGSSHEKITKEVYEL